MYKHSFWLEENSWVCFYIEGSEANGWSTQHNTIKKILRYFSANGMVENRFTLFCIECGESGGLGTQDFINLLR